MAPKATMKKSKKLREIIYVKAKQEVIERHE
jgi:hypothetical protein